MFVVKVLVETRTVS